MSSFIDSQFLFSKEKYFKKQGDGGGAGGVAVKEEEHDRGTYILWVFPGDIFTLFLLPHSYRYMYMKCFVEELELVSYNIILY